VAKPLPPMLVTALDTARDAAEDLEDGAWMQALCDTVAAYNRQYRQGYDPHATVLRYLEHK
jgi:hypothetical protein